MGSDWCPKVTVTSAHDARVHIGSLPNPPLAIPPQSRGHVGWATPVSVSASVEVFQAEILFFNPHQPDWLHLSRGRRRVVTVIVLSSLPRRSRLQRRLLLPEQLKDVLLGLPKDEVAVAFLLVQDDVEVSPPAA